MFHFSNLGSYSGVAQRFADLDGFVPVAGDSHSDFSWDSAVEWCDESWGEHLAGAIVATAEALGDIDAWRAAA